MSVKWKVLLHFVFPVGMVLKVLSTSYIGLDPFLHCMKILTISGKKGLSEGGPIVSPCFLMSLSKAFLIPK